MKRIVFYSMILAVIVSMAACTGDNTGTDGLSALNGTVLLSSDTGRIRSDGESAVTFKVTLKSENGSKYDVTGQSDIYMEGTDVPLETNRFSTDVGGTYVFYAKYGEAVSEEISVEAYDDIPVLPEDTDEENTDFRHRILIIQHTGTGCPNCPRMMKSLKTLNEDEEYSGLYHHVASHSYNKDDPAFSEDAYELSMTYNTSYLYPMLTFNLTETASSVDLDEIKGHIDAFKKPSADAGIAAAAGISGDEVIVNVQVKAAKSNTFRVAAWLLEDGIQATQAGATESWQGIHDNALRSISGSSFAGESIGMIMAGETGRKVLTLSLDDAWTRENCEVLVLVTAAGPDGDYDVVNCAMCSIGGSVAYDYSR